VVGARLAAEERGRLAAQAVFALRSAIVGMRETARRAAKELDPVLVREVHERGALAVDELRGLLGLLREPVTTPPPEAPAPRGLEGPPALAATLVPLLCLALAVASVVIAASPPSVPESLLPGAGAYAFASWAVAARPSRAAWASLGVLIAAGVWLSTAYGPHGAGFVLFVIGASAFAGLAWSEGDRILHEARLRGSELQARLDDATATALRAERLRLARELHDVASHSVGAMVLQAGAAGAVRHRDPVQARAALATVVTTSDTALRDVAELLATLETATPDNPSRDSAGPATLRSTIDRLVGTMRADGLDVSIDLAALPRSPSAAATAYRVLHEGLVNAQRHAPGEPVNVTTTREEDRYVVRVSNRMSGPSPAQGAGFGLAGLRERALASGGTLTAGTAGDGSFVLEVRLPLESGATAELS